MDTEKTPQRRQEADHRKQASIHPAPLKKRKVDPAEFTPLLTQFNAPLTRALAYEDDE